jgi:hypothetical protein
MPILTQTRILAAKIESSIGTAVSLAAADAAFKVYDRQFDIIRTTNRPQRPGGIGSMQGVPEDASTRLTFSMPMIGGTTTPTWAAIFLPACGMSYNSSARRYSMAANPANWSSITAAEYRGITSTARTKKGRGMMGSWTIRLVSGKMAMIDFDFRGGWVADPAADTILTGMSYETAQPPIFDGAASLTLASSTSYLVSDVTINMGGDIVLREDPNSDGGYLCGWIANRLPTITLAPEATPFGTRNWYALQSDVTTAGVVALSAVINGGTNNTITIASSNLQLLDSPTDGDRGGRVVDNLTFGVHEDDLTITFS